MAPNWSHPTTLSYSVVAFSSAVLSMKLKHDRIKEKALQLDAFDFSEPSKWEKFYEENVEDCYEWHSSIPLERIASYITPGSNCLMVGCGNSRLPQVVLSSYPNDAPRLVLLDTSKTCLDQLRQMYGSKVECVCGDATELSTLNLSSKTSRDYVGDRCSDNNITEQSSQDKFDIIVDKGLTDAILCGEGWNGPLKKLFKEASGVLRDRGRYLLISYRLPSSTKDFLVKVGKPVGFEWEFDIPDDSNPRVSVSVAVKENA